MSELVSESLPAQEAGTSLSLISLRWGSNEGENREAGLSEAGRGVSVPLLVLSFLDCWVNLLFSSQASSFIPILPQTKVVPDTAAQNLAWKHLLDHSCVESESFPENGIGTGCF